MSAAGQVGHTRYPSRISVPSRGLCFLGQNDLETVVRLGSAFLAGAFVFWQKHDLEKSSPSRISVPSRGFCFLGITPVGNIRQPLVGDRL